VSSRVLFRILGRLLCALWREYCADWGRRPLLRPAFRPQRRDFRISLCLLAAVFPLWLLAAWKGYLLLEIVLTGFGLVFLVPAALALTGLLWKSTWESAQRLNRILVQVAFVATLTVLLDVAGLVIDRVSEETSFKRGAEVVSAVEDYSFRHGRLPESLGVVEEDQGWRLPQPTFGDGFEYSAATDGHTFTLCFSGSGLAEEWFYDSTARQWAPSGCD
jgi:hypothetical protein